ncbi:D-lactate dehydrogenase [Swingsia samuiensis]|uniref:Quinone-dependent D-lactate dehydrogenase n=1 Tax=Swingsia samuiensis TaxID=1293412 RepID=A0A4Y6UKX6_9PROT|nr:D-lactate dehydrogenase [Swingsia samuiensis]QDH17027.1 D-lactate dehydrogenase [Swingsia samuiensis]
MASILLDLRKVVSSKYVLTSESATYAYRKGFRFGEGRVEAVVQPGSLVELWRVASIAVNANRIVLMQASNTGLTGGSSPDGNNYDRPIILINTKRLKGIQLLGDGRQVVCLPGAELYELEKILSPLGREPHSVIGSSCIGASVLGGISNNSGGALIQRGPAFTQMALFGQVDQNGKLQLVNHLGIKLRGEPEEVLEQLQKGLYFSDDVNWAAGQGHDADYVNRIRDVEAHTPGRYNADPERLYEASGCAGKLVVFAVRLDTFPAAQETVVFYVGTNETQKLEELRRGLLTQFEELPIAGEYIHRDAFAIADRYGRDTVASIRYMGTKNLPFFFRIKARIDQFGQRFSWLPEAISEHALQWLSYVLPCQIPSRIMDYHKRYEHHLMLKVTGSMAVKIRPWLEQFFQGEAHKGASFECSEKEGKLAFLHRFAAAGAANRYNIIHRKETGGMLALDVALRRNDKEWFESLPKEIDDQLVVKLYYGHFLCHVLHQDYVVKAGLDPMAVEKSMWPELDKRGARYPAEHNVGHLYYAPKDMVAHYQKLDPCNCMNPGIGHTTKSRNWVAESV